MCVKAPAKKRLSAGVCALEPLLRKHQLHLRADLPIAGKLGSHHIVIPANLSVHRQPANLEELAGAGAIGTVQTCEPLASQLAVMIGAVVRYAPPSKL